MVIKTKFRGILVLPLVLSIFFFSLASYGQETSRQVISLRPGPVTSPFSPALLVGNTLYISGQLAVNPETGEFIGGTMAEQAERIIKNIELLLKKAGMDLSHVVQTSVFITDFDEFGEFNQVYQKLFPKPAPTRATVQVVRLARGAKIEISAVALK